MQIQILKPGILSTVQDSGRMDYLSQAVPVSGVMDTLSARISNLAVGNPGNAATIEFTFGGAEFRTETDVLIAYAGDGATLQCGTEELPAERPIFLPAGSVVGFLTNPDGARTYLAVAGGWEVPEVLGSKSTYLTAGFGGHEGRALKKGDLLQASTAPESASINILKKLQGSKINYLRWSIPREMFLERDRKMIRVVPGREFTAFNSSSILNFLSEPFTIGLNSNRMGFNLEGSPIALSRKEELLSTAVCPGTIQVTGSGNMVLLMADCQATGGYPRIAQVTAVDLSLCAQLKPGDTIRFTAISREEAEMLYIERERELTKLSGAVNSRF